MPTLRWRSTLTAMGYRRPFRVLAFARLGSQPLKLALPVKGGEAFRALYMSRRQAVPLTDAVASILFDMFLVASAQLTFLCVGLLLAEGPITRALLPTAGLFCLALFLASRWTQNLALKVAARIHPKLHQKLEQLAHGFLKFPLTTKLRLFALSLCVEATELASMVLVCATLGLDIPVLTIITYMPAVMFFTLIPITISGLGTRELAIVFLFVGYATQVELTSAALLFTAVEFILPALVGCLFLPPFLARLADKSPKEAASEPS